MFSCFTGCTLSEAPPWGICTRKLAPPWGIRQNFKIKRQMPHKCGMGGEGMGALGIDRAIIVEVSVLLKCSKYAKQEFELARLPIKSLTNKNVLNRLSPKKAKSLQSKGIFKSHSMSVVQDYGFNKFPVKEFSFQSQIPCFSKTLTVLHVKDFPFISLEISFLSSLTIFRQ